MLFNASDIRGVAEISTTSGIDDYVLNGAITNGFRFQDKVVDGTSDLLIKVSDSGPQVEFSLCTFNYPNILVVNEIISSTNNDLKISWPTTGQRIVELLVPAGFKNLEFTEFNILGTPLVANAVATNSIAAFEGVATSPEFCEVSLRGSITSNQPMGFHFDAVYGNVPNNKVGIYGSAKGERNLSNFGADANIWATNFLVEGSFGYQGEGQGVEVDVNNATGGDRLTDPYAAGFTILPLLGIQVTGSGTNRSTVAYVATGTGGATEARWQFGYSVYGDFSQACFYAHPNPSSKWGLNLEGSYDKAAIGIGIEDEVNELSGNVVQIRQGVDNNFVIRNHQSLSSGASISMLNDANNAFEALEIQASEVLFSQGFLALANITAPPAPPSGQTYIYRDAADGTLKAKGSVTTTPLAIN